MAQVELSSREASIIDKGLRKLRDVHYRAYYDSKDYTGETAQANKAKAEHLDELRNRILREAN